MASQKLPELQDAARKAGQVLQAVSATESAREQHKLAQLWTRVTKLLAPDGLRAEVFAEKIDGLNTTMAAIARKAGWAAPPIMSPKLVCTMDAWDSRVLSEARLWCMSSALILAIASMHGCPVMVLDRADVLDSISLEPALRAVDALARAADIGCVITMKAGTEDEFLAYGIEWMSVEIQDERL